MLARFLPAQSPRNAGHASSKMGKKIILRFLNFFNKLSLQSFDHQNFFSRKIDKLMMMCAKGPHVSILMTNDFVVSFGKRISVFCNRFVLLYTFSPKVT
jgi:hypothetical protein